MGFRGYAFIFQARAKDPHQSPPDTVQLDLANSGCLSTMPKGDLLTQLIYDASSDGRQNRTFGLCLEKSTANPIAAKIQFYCYNAALPLHPIDLGCVISLRGDVVQAGLSTADRFNERDISAR